uniref:Radical SAM superfamily n=1 Tax=Streptomyces rimofaciens TaxID=504097 RepID=H9BDW6_9ACTN|nr:radical SAM superfamily [Streptomyces rimofaciens]
MTHPATGPATGGRDRYLFIRILEACNADCFMCEFALSRDTYRFTLDDFRELLPQAQESGVRYVRFTGGEPLMHGEVLDLIREGTAAGMRMSLITNGFRLPQMVDKLAEAGLAQVIVSLDGSSGETHDVYRRTPGMFDRGLDGLVRASRAGMLTRVNTVVGPHNFAQMPELQRVLTEARVEQWEMSALKLERHIAYPPAEEVLHACEPVFLADPKRWLVPLGKRFYGETAEEREAFFERGTTPSASRPLCHVTDDVMYLDPKLGRTFACSCLPHRDGPGADMRDERGRVFLNSPSFRAHAEEFKQQGPVICSGCSTTAAGYSDDVARLGSVPAWHY